MYLSFGLLNRWINEKACNIFLEKFKVLFRDFALMMELCF